MSNETTDWSQNCLTQGIHNGREGAIWDIPLSYAAAIFSGDTLRKLVVERIYNDAMQYVEQSPFVQKGTEEAYTFTQDWADAIKKHADTIYHSHLRQKVGEINKYYKTPSVQQDLDRAVARADKLAPAYEPLHPHDTINMLCRIIGVSASIKASRELEEES